MADHAPHFMPCALQQVDVWSEAGREALSGLLGFAAPEEFGEVAGQNGIRVARISPRRFWVIGTLPLIRLSPEDGAAVLLDQGRVCLTLSSAQAGRVLPQVMAIDWESPLAAPGRIVLSAIHRVPVAVLPQEAGRYELIVPRSFAESIGGLIAELQEA